jgi:adenylate cyclase
MREDEEATVHTITAYRTAMTHLIEQYRGRVVDSPGDNILAEFTSVVDAVNCGVEIQRELAERNAELSDNRKMRFRIGINLGDILEEGKRIYGDGVNIAARMEGLAEAGEICISGTVYDAVESKIGLEYEYLGEHDVKNIDKPIRAYRVLSYPGAAAHRVVKAKKAVGKTWRNAIIAIVAVLVVGAAVAIWHFYFRAPPIEPASKEKMAYPLPDKPSIAVLPFVNMSGDPNQEYFSDGLTEQIISTLSKLSNLFVIARNSTFTYKGKAVKVQKVAEDLGVKYVLEGSVKRSADRVRITAQLIDAISGHHVWSEHYDREIKDIFKIQDNITMEIVRALQLKLADGEQARLWAKYKTTNLKAYEKTLLGNKLLAAGTKEHNARARQLYEEAIALDSGYAPAYVVVGWTHFFDARFGWSESRAGSIKMALKYCQKVLTLDDTLDTPFILLAAIYLLKHQYEKAIAEAERSISLNPSSADAYSVLAGTLGCSGRWEESIVVARKSIRLNPFPQIYYFHWLARAYFMTRRYNEAVGTCKKILGMNPNYLPAHAFLAACYSSLGRQAEASAEADDVLRINPKFSLESYAKTLPYKNKVDKERYIDALRKAGLPTTPSLPLPDKPSIAVLPFVNMSGDTRQEYFSDGITEEIITALSKTKKLFVIARNSAFTYKGKPVKVQHVGRELGVKYVLEGSVRKDEDKVRITAQLVDALTGHHIWAERYDRKLKDFFGLQDEITLRILTSLQVELTDGERARVYGKGTKNLEAYIKVLQGREYFWRLDKESNIQAKKLFKEAINFDPKYPAPYWLLGMTHIMDVWYGWGRPDEDSLALVMELAKKTISLDDSDSNGHGLLGAAFRMKMHHDKAIAECKRAIELNPNSADAHVWLGTILCFADRAEEGVPLLEKAIRLNPFAHHWYLTRLGSAYRMTGRYKEALKILKKALLLSPNSMVAHMTLTITYIQLGRDEEARAHAAEVLKISPEFSVDRLSEKLPYKNQAEKRRVINALRKAGLK